MLDPALLEALAAVVREGSFERAARVLNVTPSAVSQRVKLLEERTGRVLVVRGQPCTATDAGHRLCRHAEALALLERELLDELPLPGADPSGRATVRLAANADSLATWLMPALAAFAEDRPVLLQLSVDDQDHTDGWLRAGEVRAAITARATPVQGCRSVALGSLRYRATASPAFVRRWFPDGVTAPALAAAPSLVYDAKDTLQAQWAERMAGAPVALPRHWVPSSTGFVDACRAGLGWGLNPEALVKDALADGTLLALGAGAAGEPLDVPLFWQHTRARLPLLDRLTDAVVAAARQALVPPPHAAALERAA